MKMSDFKYEIDDGAVTITSYTGAGGDVIVPSTIGGLPVTIIGSYAFYGCKGLTSITLPNSVTSIGAYAFRKCTGLPNITLPDRLTSIGKHVLPDLISFTSRVNHTPVERTDKTLVELVDAMLVAMEAVRSNTHDDWVDMVFKRGEDELLTKLYPHAARMKKAQWLLDLINSNIKQRRKRIAKARAAAWQKKKHDAAK